MLSSLAVAIGMSGGFAIGTGGGFEIGISGGFHRNTHRGERCHRQGDFWPS